jgi:hypothetical protein
MITEYPQFFTATILEEIIKTGQVQGYLILAVGEPIASKPHAQHQLR